MTRKKKNTVAKEGFDVVTYSQGGGAQRVAASAPRPVAGEGPSARGPPSELLTTEEAAAVLRCSESSLNKWRVTGNGPRFVRVGSRVRYSRADLADFIADQTRTSTSQAASPPA
jgi:excisionase family DNA binding protein